MKPDACQSDPAEVLRAQLDIDVSRTRSSEFFDLEPVGYVTVSKMGLILHANITAATLLGVEHGSLVQQPLSRFVLKEDTDKYYLLHKQLLATGEAHSCELRMVKNGGTPFWAYLAATATQDESGSSILHFTLSNVDARKKTENALLEKEERLTLATSLSGVGIWDWNLTSGKLIWEESMFALYHISRADFGGTEEAWRATLHPDDLEFAMQEASEALSGKKPYDTEFRVVWPNGEIRHIKAVARVFCDKQGTPVRVLGTNWDITALKQAEAALQGSEGLLRRALEATKEGVWEWNILTNEEFFSRRWCEILGYTADDPELPHTYNSWLERVHPLDVEHVLLALTDHLEKNIPYSVVYRHRHRSGQYRWQSSRGVSLRDASGKATKMTGCIADITERKQAEEALNASVEFRGKLIASMQDGFSLLDANGVHSEVNPAFCKMTGFSHEELIGVAPPFPYWPPEELETIGTAFTETINGNIRDLELTLMRKNGERFPAIVSPSAIKNREGETINYFATLKDITERKRAEESIRQLNTELEIRVAERTAELRIANEELSQQIILRRQLEVEILAISEREQRRIGQDLHDDLGQQLAGIWMLSSALARKLANDGITEEQAATRISDLLEKSVTMTRSLARGLHPVEPESGGLMSALHALATRVSALFQIDCRFECPIAVPMDDAIAATHLYRIAQEAVTNGVKHGHAKSVHIRLSSDQAATTLTVIDSGNGMELTAPIQPGMGLRIMHYRAGMIGATVSIENLSGGGVSVTCTLPKPPTPA